MNKLIIRLTAISALLIFLLPGCSLIGANSNNFSTETRVLENFYAINFDGIGNIKITKGENNSITIVSETNFINSLKTNIVDGVLSISATSNLITSGLDPGKSIQFYITFTNLTNLDLDGNYILTGDSISGEFLQITANGVGTVDIENVRCERLDINLSGGGAVTISGAADEQQITISGAHYYDAGDLRSKIISAHISGASNVVLWAEETLNVSLSEISSVGYFGNLEIMSSTDHPNIIFLGLK